MKKQICEFDLNLLFPIAMTIIVLGIAIGYGMNVMGDIRDDIKADLSCTTINNESIAALGNTSTVNCNFVKGSGYYILVNASGVDDGIYENLTILTTANISISEGGDIRIHHGDVTDNESFANYCCVKTTTDYNASKDAIDGVAKIPSKLPLIVTVIIAAVIIGLLTKYLIVRYS